MKKDISSINDELKYQRIGWPIRTVFWILVILVLAYGLLGGFGDYFGPLSKKRVELGGSVVQYEPYLRVEKSFTLDVLIPDTATSAVIGFDDSYAERIKITDIMPEPDEVTINDSHVYYHFKTRMGGKIVFFQDPVKPGKHHVEFSVNGAKTILKQFIFF